MKGHEHFITCSIVVSKYLVPDRDSNRQRSHRREECNWKEKEEQGGKKVEGENFFSETKINKERFIRNFKVARKGERKRGKDCGETISHAFGKGGIADERKGGQRFDGGLLGTVRRPFGSTGSGTTW